MTRDFICAGKHACLSVGRPSEIYKIDRSTKNYQIAPPYPQMYTKEQEDIAQEIAYKLNDPGGMGLYLKYAKTIPREILAERLDRVLTMPDYRINTTRARYFTHLIENYRAYKHLYNSRR